MILLDLSIWLTSLDHVSIDVMMNCDIEINDTCSLPFSIDEIDLVSLKKKNIYSFQ